MNNTDTIRTNLSRLEAIVEAHGLEALEAAPEYLAVDSTGASVWYRAPELEQFVR